MLALGFNEREDVMIGEDRLVVERINGDLAATLRFETPHMNHKYELIENRDIQLKPYIVVSMGVPRDDGSALTLCIEAPRRVQITRGRLYRKWGNSHDRPKHLTKPA